MPKSRALYGGRFRKGLVIIYNQGCPGGKHHFTGKIFVAHSVRRVDKNFCRPTRHRSIIFRCLLLKSTAIGRQLHLFEGSL